MREIKFRVWDKVSNRFFSEEILNKLPLDVFLSSENIQQFTGLKDKNGKEIYEGDVIQHNRRSSYDGINFEVKWNHNNWGWVLVSRNKDYLVNEWTPEGNRYNFIEVVGNILENPNLIS